MPFSSSHLLTCTIIYSRRDTKQILSIRPYLIRDRIPQVGSTSRPSFATRAVKIPVRYYVGAVRMFKQRSHDTHHDTHRPQITSNPNQYTIALFGDSLFERFKTTGSNLPINNNPLILNLGVGGDKVLNVQYRIDQGLLRNLQNNQPNLKLMYIHMGSNNLKKYGLRKIDADGYATVIKNIRDALPNVKIVITALFKQRGLADEIIDEANQMLRDVAFQNHTDFLPFGDDQEGIMSQDNVHLNGFGYAKWNAILETDMASR